MRVILQLVLFITMVSPLFSDELLPIIQADLSRYQWGGEFKSAWQYILKIKNDNTFEASLSAEGGDEKVEGVFIIKGKNIIFKMNNTSSTPDDKSNEFSPYRFFDNKEYRLVKPEFPVHYSEYLYCPETKVKIWNTGKTVNAGFNSKIDDCNVIILGVISGKTLDNVKLRQMPSISSKAYSYLDIDKEKSFDYLPKGTKIKLIAVTKDKFNVNSIENNWYYVEVSSSHYYQRGWVFGEYITKSDK